MTDIANRKLHEEDLAKPTDWSAVFPQPPYLFRPSVSNPFKTVFSHDSEELRLLYKLCKDVTLSRPFPDHPALFLAHYPPAAARVSTKPRTQQEAEDIKTLNFNHLQKKFGPTVNLPYTSFTERRLIDLPKFQWECDQEKDLSNKEIFSRLHYGERRTRRGKTVPTKEPLFHSDDLKLILPTWIY